MIPDYIVEAVAWVLTVVIAWDVGRGSGYIEGLKGRKK